MTRRERFIVTIVLGIAILTTLGWLFATMMGGRQ